MSGPESALWVTEAAHLGVKGVPTEKAAEGWGLSGADVPPSPWPPVPSSSGTWAPRPLGAPAQAAQPRRNVISLSSRGGLVAGAVAETVTLSGRV